MNKALQQLKEQIATVLVGREETTGLVLTALLAGGHVLLEDMPGTGKTLLAKTLAASFGGSFSRIQFTPDLLPSDITGIHFYQQNTGTFVLKKGPVFAQILLADEINRATPRTQSALLECMEEGQVSIDGETLPLPQPFFVIATQNPIETAGTFPLPEAQLDRFAMKLSMGTITPEQEVFMLERFEGKQPLKQVHPVMAPEELEACAREAEAVFLHPDLKNYIVNLCQETRHMTGVLAGVSPRATLVLARCAKAYAYLQERTFVTPEDVAALAVPVLAHRLVLKAELNWQSTPEQMLVNILERVNVPTEDWSH
jgi:MoxR-like ATPase